MSVRFLLAAGAMGGLVVATAPAHAELIISMQQVGSNVVATSSGSLDISAGLTPFANATIGSFVGGSFSNITVGTSGNDAIYLGPTGPASFGSGGLIGASSTSGEIAGMDLTLGTPGEHLVDVPDGYVSGDPLSGTSTWDNSTFSSLGVTPGTYTWSWSTDAGLPVDSVVLDIGTPTSVPEPASLTIFGVSLAAFGAMRRKRKAS